MKGRLHYINQINDQLVWLATRAASSSKDNRQDMNIVAESIVCGLLNRMYDWDLVNANSQKQNFAGVDLVDEDACVAVQVTSTNKVRKVNHTMEEFFANELEKKFDRVIVLVITFSEPTDGMKKVSHEPWFSGSRDIWNFQYLLNVLEQLDVPRLKEICEYLQSELDMDGCVRQPTHLLPGVSAPAPSFVPDSRNRELEDLEKLLAQNVPIFLWGVGGIGKTEVAIQLARQFAPPQGAYFLHYYYDMPGQGPALRETILRADFTGYRYQGVDTENRDHEYRERMDMLRTEYAGALLIIDNFDRENMTLEELKAEPAYKELLSLGLQLVFTTRSPVPGGYEIRHLKEDHLLALMQKNLQNVYVEKKQMQAMIRAVDGHTLMVDLISKTLEESWEKVTPEMMLRALHNSELDQRDFPEVVTDWNQSYEQRQIYAHMKALFDLSGLCDEDRAVLRYATLLPDDGMNAGLFWDCISQAHRKPLQNLTKRGLLRREKGLLTIHPVIREVSRGELKPTDENCRPFLNSLWKRFDRRKHYDAELYLQIAKCYAIAVDRLEDKRLDWLKRIGWYWRKLGRFQTALSYEMQLLTALENQSEPNYFSLAFSYQNLGVICSQLSDHHKALDYHYKALYLWENKMPRNLQATATAYTNIGYAYNDLGMFDKALEYKLKALQIRQSGNPPDELALATSYTCVGYTYCDLGEYEKALDYQKKGLEIRERILPPNHPHVAISYNNIGYDYLMLGAFEEALEYQQKALDIRKDVMLPDSTAIAVSYNDIGDTLASMGKYQQSLEQHRKSMEICRRALPADHLYLATSYMGIGRALGRLGELSQGLEYLEKCLEIRLEKLPADHRYIAYTRAEIDWVREEAGRRAIPIAP